MRKKKFSPSVRTVASLAMLCAVSIILGKYLQIPFGEVLRFSFENLPIIFAGIVFGPICGMLVGAVADIVGCILVGYTINPIVTLGAVLIGGVSGGVALLFGKLPVYPERLRTVMCVASAHLLGSVLVKTFGLAEFYDIPLGALMLWRLLNYVIIGTLECILLTVLLRSRAIIHAVGAVRHELKYGEREKYSKGGGPAPVNGGRSMENYHPMLKNRSSICDADMAENNHKSVQNAINPKNASDSYSAAGAAGEAGEAPDAPITESLSDCSYDKNVNNEVDGNSF